MTPDQVIQFLSEQVIGRWPHDTPLNPTQYLDWCTAIGDLDYELAAHAMQAIAVVRQFPTRPQPGELRRRYLATLERALAPGEVPLWQEMWHLLVQCFPEPLPVDGVDPRDQEPEHYQRTRQELWARPYGRLAWRVATLLGREFMRYIPYDHAQARFRDAFEQAVASGRESMLVPQACGGVGLEQATARVLEVMPVDALRELPAPGEPGEQL